jgi:hypothetical protein
MASAAREKDRPPSAAQDLDQLFELDAQLSRELVRLRDVDARFLAVETIARSADREALVV